MGLTCISERAMLQCCVWHIPGDPPLEALDTQVSFWGGGAWFRSQAVLGGSATLHGKRRKSLLVSLLPPPPVGCMMATHGRGVTSQAIQSSVPHPPSPPLCVGFLAAACVHWGPKGCVRMRSFSHWGDGGKGGRGEAGGGGRGERPLQNGGLPRLHGCGRVRAPKGRRIAAMGGWRQQQFGLGAGGEDDE